MSIVKIRAALETALDAMPGILPAVDIVDSVNGVFKTASPHRFEPGLHATVSNHNGEAAANGKFQVAETPTEDTFTLDDIPSGLDVISNGTGGSVIANLTAWENWDFPVLANRVPYQEVHLLPGRPEDVTMGKGYRREFGIFQVTLVYPLQLGTGEVGERAELIKATFPRGASFSNGGIVVHIDITPEVMRGFPHDDSYRVPVRVYYYADIFDN